jgi:hypothetical protein
MRFDRDNTRMPTLCDMISAWLIAFVLLLILVLV